MENLTINNLNSNISYCEAQGLSNLFKAYAENINGESIFEIGFNANSGYTYIALNETSITLCSMLGRDVEYMVTDFDGDSEETFFDTYQEAIDYLNNLKK
jgi:hypothetical protein